MQLLGVYRNCWCMAHKGVVVLSTDTQSDREHAHVWLRLGFGSIRYILLLCFLGWGYLTRMKVRVKEQIDALRS